MKDQELLKTQSLDQHEMDFFWVYLKYKTATKYNFTLNLLGCVESYFSSEWFQFKVRNNKIHQKKETKEKIIKRAFDLPMMINFCCENILKKWNENTQKKQQRPIHNFKPFSSSPESFHCFAYVINLFIRLSDFLFYTFNV